jgi:hypothetical protein
MGKFVLIVIGIALFVYALFDLVATPRERVRYIPKPVWFLVILLAGIGPLLWLIAGRERSAPPRGGKAPPAPPRPGPRGPDDDPDYLRGL